MKSVFAMHRQFNSDYKYLNKYYYANIAVFAALNVVLLYHFSERPEIILYYLPGLLLFASPKFLVTVFSLVYFVAVSVFLYGWEQSAWGALLILASIPATTMAAGLLHNASHKNLFSNGALSRVVGEAFGVFSLVGFPDWHVVHNLHHRYSDDLEKDPHPPGGQSFWSYLNSFKANAGKVLARNYFERHGESAEAKKAWGQLSYLLPINQLLRSFFWFLVFGPFVFTFFYVASYINKNLLYADFNYRTHYWENGKGELRNVNFNLFYKFINTTCFGLYYHKNHHLNPNLFDPRNFALADLAQAELAMDQEYERATEY